MLAEIVIASIVTTTILVVLIVQPWSPGGGDIDDGDNTPDVCLQIPFSHGGVEILITPICRAAMADATVAAVGRWLLWPPNP